MVQNHVTLCWKVWLLLKTSLPLQNLSPKGTCNETNMIFTLAVIEYIFLSIGPLKASMTNWGGGGIQLTFAVTWRSIFTAGKFRMEKLAENSSPSGASHAVWEQAGSYRDRLSSTFFFFFASPPKGFSGTITLSLPQGSRIPSCSIDHWQVSSPTAI